jgi:hypothetical protein
MENNLQLRCFELVVKEYPYKLVTDLDDLRTRIDLSREFLKPELLEKLENALIEQENNPRMSPKYIKFMAEKDQDGHLIIVWVYSSVHGVLVDVRQREYNTPLDIPDETFEGAIRDMLREKVKKCLLKYGVRIS